MELSHGQFCLTERFIPTYTTTVKRHTYNGNVENPIECINERLQKKI